MPKMGLEATLDELEKGQTWPGTRAFKFAVPIDDLKKYGQIGRASCRERV